MPPPHTTDRGTVLAEYREQAWAQQPTRVGVGLRPDQADPGRNFEALVVELDLEFGVAGLRPGERVDQLVEALGRFEKTHRRTHRDFAAADASTVTETES